MSDDRHSFTEHMELITDPAERAQREVENGLGQFDVMTDIIRSYVKTKTPFLLKAREIIRLQSAALAGIDPLAGTFRNTPVLIRGSRHSPPDSSDVPDEVMSLCAYVNNSWRHKSAIHLAAYVLWKLNWIHPFSDGNGRTARAVSYAVLCIKLDGLLPGAPTIPEQIAASKGPYYDALEKADQAAEEGRIDVSQLEEMLGKMLANQLLSIAALSESAEDRIRKIVENRIGRADLDDVRKLYGTAKPDGRTWQISLDQVAFQVAGSEEISAAADRMQKFGNPFPGLISTGQTDHRQRLIRRDEDGTILVDHVFLDTNENGVLLLDDDVSIGLLNPEVSSALGKWSTRGALYVMKYGKNLTPDNMYDAIDLLLAKHLSAA